MEICPVGFVKDVPAVENMIVKNVRFGDFKQDLCGVDIVNILIYLK